jgi:hypothetical protein
MVNAVTYGIPAAVFALGLFPLLHHLSFGLFERRREILGYFSDKSICLYFEQFYSAEAPYLSKNPRAALRAIYNDRFGARTFALPGIVYIASLALSVFILISSVLDSSWPGIKIETRGLYALAGAYLWVALDLISRYRQRDVVPSALYWYSFRFIVAIPMAYALSTFFSDAAAPPAAFLLGAFPTSTLMLLVRRQATQRFGLGDNATETKSELEAIMNTTLAEKFSEVGISTLLQLAYEDPIQLAMRTNLSINYITDIISQALAMIYGLDLAITRPLSIRGALEAADTYNDLFSEGSSESEKKMAQSVVQELAKAKGVPDEIIEKVLHDIAKDPYTVFLSEVWA